MGPSEQLYTIESYSSFREPLAHPQAAQQASSCVANRTKSFKANVQMAATRVKGRNHADKVGFLADFSDLTSYFQQSPHQRRWSQHWWMMHLWTGTYIQYIRTLLFAESMFATAWLYPFPDQATVSCVDAGFGRCSLRISDSLNRESSFTNSVPHYLPYTLALNIGSL